VGINIVEPQAEDTQTELATRSHERDADQQGIDATVKGMVDGYNTAGGKDSAVTARPTHRYQVPNGDKSELKRMIRRACVLHKVDPIWYKDSKPDDAGNLIVKFTVGPLKAKADATPTPNGDQPAEAPAVDEVAALIGDQPQAEQRKRFGR
jgi:hypothetical protein